MASPGILSQSLFTESRDFLLTKQGASVKADALAGKVVGVIMAPHWLPATLEHAISLISEAYKKLQNCAFAFVYVAVERDEEYIDTMRLYGETSQVDERPDPECFADVLRRLPDGCFAVPLEDVETRIKIAVEYKAGLSSLAFFGADGRLHSEKGLALLEKWGAEGYPFDDDRIVELRKARGNTQSLQDLLVHEGRDNLISSEEGKMVKVASLVGKTVGLYFSAHWCPPCTKFTPKLISVYSELKGRGEEFEVIFMPGDRDEESFSDYYGSMPWLALPFNDKALSSLAEYLDIETIPQLVIIGPNGKTVTTEGHNLIKLFGAEAFPFTEDRIVEVKAAIHRKYQEFPKEVTCEKHDHTLTLTENAYRRQVYVCDDCSEQGFGWVYQCAECGYDLHPQCIGEVKSKAEETGQASEGEGDKQGYTCDGDVCRRL